MRIAEPLNLKTLVSLSDFSIDRASAQIRRRLFSALQSSRCISAGRYH